MAIGVTPKSVWPTLDRCDPALVLLGYHLPRGDGLQICDRIKQRALPPRVLLYSAYAGQTLALPAVLARADGLVDKGVGALALFEAIRLVHGGERVLPPVSPRVLEDAMRRLDPDDHALVGMLLDGASEADVAATLRLQVRDVRHSVQRILSRCAWRCPPRAAEPSQTACGRCGSRRRRPGDVPRRTSPAAATTDLRHRQRHRGVSHERRAPDLPAAVGDPHPTGDPFPVRAGAGRAGPDPRPMHRRRTWGRMGVVPHAVRGAGRSPCRQWPEAGSG
jgi:DNA-binding NarL/FixJ family response regulator